MVVEADIAAGMPAYETVGLPGAAVRESRGVRAAIKTPALRTRSSASASIARGPEKTGRYTTCYCGGAALRQRAGPQPDETAHFLASFRGRAAARRGGALPMAISAKEAGIRRLFIAAVNADEAAYVDIEVYRWKR